MNKIFILAILLSFLQNAYGYSNHSLLTSHIEESETNEPSGNVVGTIIDETSKEPVMYATVTIVAPGTTKPLDGTVTDEKGKFSIAKVNAGEYDIIISFIGYETKVLKGIKIENKMLDLGKVLLGEGNKVLEEVTVSGQRDMFEEKVDRTVYNAEQDESNRGGDAGDVLRKVPMLSVDLDGNVSLRGSQNITVLINNRPSTITAGSIADALKQIPADVIKSVEVITSPSARYDAEGSAGIINIVTKKNALQGGSLNINLGTGFRGSNLGLNGNYKVGKFGFSLGGFGRAGYNMPGSFENEQRSVGEDGVNTISQKADTRNNMMFGRYTLGYEYDINEKNFLNGSVQFGLRNGHNYQDGLSLDRQVNGTPFSSSYSDVDMTNNSNTLDVNLNFTHTFDKPQHDLSILTQFSRNNRVNNFLNQMYDGADFSNMYMQLKNINLSYNEESTIQLDYQNPIAKNQLVEMGAKQIIRTVISDFETLTALENGEFERTGGGDLSNVFRYDQNVSAGYFSYMLTTENKYSLKVGARYEHTTIGARYEDGEGAIEIPDYGVLVPSINLSKGFSGGTVKFSYNRRLQRPSLQFLNPNRQNPNPAIVTIGNPFLDPEFTDNLELGYSTYFKAGFLNLTGYARNTNNSIQAVRETLDEGVLQTSYFNIGRESAFGTSIFGGLNLGTKFSLNGGGDVFYADLDNNIQDGMQREFNSGIVYNIRAFANYDLKKGWGLQGFGFYRGKQVQLQGYQTGFYIYSLNVRKEFHEKRGSIGFGAENFFNGRGMVIRNEVSSRTGNFSQSSINVMQNFNLRVNFSYRIGKMTSNTGSKRRAKSISNDDMKSGGGGSQDMDASQGNGGGMQGGGGFSAGAQRGRGQVPAAKPPVGDLNGNDDGITGRWQGQMGRFELTIDLIVDGENLKGMVYTAMGESPVQDGSVNGDEFSFKISAGPNEIHYKGRKENDQLLLFGNFMGRDVEGSFERVQ